MDALGINGSPRPEGNSALALRHALTHLEKAGLSTHYVALAEKTIHPCNGCWACRTGPCVYMAAVADGPRFSHSGATIVGQAEDDEVGLKTVDNLGERIVSVLRLE